MDQTGSHSDHISLNSYLEHWTHLHLLYRLPLVLFIGSSSSASRFCALYVMHFISNSSMTYAFQTVLVFLYNSAILIFTIDLWDLDSPSPYLVHLPQWCSPPTCTVFIIFAGWIHGRFTHWIFILWGAHVLCWKNKSLFHIKVNFLLHHTTFCNNFPLTILE